MSPDVRIGYLVDHPEALPTLERLFQSEWAAYYGAAGPGNAQQDLVAYSNRGQLPVGVIRKLDYSFRHVPKDKQKGDYVMRTKLRKGQIAIGSSEVHLPKGGSMEIDVYTQKDGGVYVTQYFRKKSGGIKEGETCFFCDGVALGCLTCPKGQRPVGDCIKRTITCEAFTITTGKKKAAKKRVK